MRASLLTILLAGMLLAVAETSRAQLLNGNFATGDLTDWTVFTTMGYNPPSQGGTTLAQVAPFDITGTGNPVNCALFEVGETGGQIGGGGLGQGAGIYQNVFLNAGLMNISLNIGAVGPGDNSDAGTFQLLVDGTVVASDSVGPINANQTILSALDYTGQITGGEHQIAFDIVRGGGTEYPDTPFEYLGDIQLGVNSSVPESTNTLFGLGLICLAGVSLRKFIHRAHQ